MPLGTQLLRLLAHLREQQLAHASSAAAAGQVFGRGEPRLGTHARRGGRAALRRLSADRLEQRARRQRAEVLVAECTEEVARARPQRPGELAVLVIKLPGAGREPLVDARAHAGLDGLVGDRADGWGKGVGRRLGLGKDELVLDRREGHRVCVKMRREAVDLAALLGLSEADKVTSACVRVT